jgi:hypothetical protein
MWLLLMRSGEGRGPASGRAHLGRPCSLGRRSDHVKARLLSASGFSLSPGRGRRAAEQRSVP